MATFNDAYGYCNCDTPAYYFSFQLQLCAIDCNEKPHTKQSIYPSEHSCECILGYEWDASLLPTGNCSIKCSGVFDAGVESETTCTCEANAFFDSYINACNVNCFLDNLSTKAWSAVGCVCKEGAEWDETINKCGCKTGYTVSSDGKSCETDGATGAAAIGAMAGVVSTSIAVVLGKFIYDRRKKSQEGSEEEKVEENQRGTAQDLKVDEMVE